MKEIDPEISWENLYFVLAVNAKTLLCALNILLCIIPFNKHF